jgi:hypothetical protein
MQFESSLKTHREWIENTQRIYGCSHRHIRAFESEMRAFESDNMLAFYHMRAFESDKIKIRETEAARVCSDNNDPDLPAEKINLKVLSSFKVQIKDVIKFYHKIVLKM